MRKLIWIRQLPDMSASIRCLMRFATYAEVTFRCCRRGSLSSQVWSISSLTVKTEPKIFARRALTLPGQPSTMHFTAYFPGLDRCTRYTRLIDKAYHAIACYTASLSGKRCPTKRVSASNPHWEPSSCGSTSERTVISSSLDVT